MGLRPGQTNNKNGRPKGSKNQNKELTQEGIKKVVIFIIPTLLKATKGDVKDVEILLSKAYGKTAQKTEETEITTVRVIYDDKDGI